jgi:hypothetical protein
VSLEENRRSSRKMTVPTKEVSMLMPCRLRWLVVAVTAALLMCPLTSGEQPRRTATVHLRFVDYRGNDPGIGVVTQFDDESSKKFAYRFGDNVARNIPFGTYHLQAHKLLFAHTDRTIPAYQRNVWAVIQLNVDEENGPLRYRLEGTVTGLPSETDHFWVRAHCLYSGVIADTQTKSGRFEIAGLPAGAYILTTRQGSRVLNTRNVLVPQQEQKSGVVVPVVIKPNP